MDTSAAIPRLIQKLEALKSRDRSLQVFGASTHNYECIAVPEDDIIDLEARIGVALPGDYRSWLAQVGYGAGPHYGLFSPRQVASELRYGELGTGGDIPDAASLSADDVGRYLRVVQAAGTHVGARITTNSFVAALPVNHQGCGGYTHILTSGELRGSMFGECGDLIGAPWTATAAFWPEAIGLDTEIRRQPLSFFGWFEHWLETSLAWLS